MMVNYYVGIRMILWLVVGLCLFSAGATNSLGEDAKQEPKKEEPKPKKIVGDSPKAKKTVKIVGVSIKGNSLHHHGAILPQNRYYSLISNQGLDNYCPDKGKIKYYFRETDVQEWKDLGPCEGKDYHKFDVVVAVDVSPGD